MKHNSKISTITSFYNFTKYFTLFLLHQPYCKTKTLQNPAWVPQMLPNRFSCMLNQLRDLKQFAWPLCHPKRQPSTLC